MKRLTVFLFILLLGVSYSSFARSSDYFLGTWNVLIQDTPQGNVNVILSIERIDGKLTGKFTQAGSDQGTAISNIKEEENGITLYFFAEGNDLYLNLKGTEDDKVSGSLVDQFLVSGERVKEGN